MGSCSLRAFQKGSKFLCPCMECPSAFASPGYLHRHLKCSHNDLFWQMVGRGQIDALAPKMDSHGFGNRNPPNARCCGGRSTGATSLRGFQQRSTFPCPCEECPVAFSSQTYLHRHLKCSHNDLYWQLMRSGQIEKNSYF